MPPASPVQVSPARLKNENPCAPAQSGFSHARAVPNRVVPSSTPSLEVLTRRGRCRVYESLLWSNSLEFAVIFEAEKFRESDFN